MIIALASRTESVTPSLHPADAISFDAMKARGEAGVQMRWVHHFFFQDEAGACQASRMLQSTGWSVDCLSAQPQPFPGWTVKVYRDVVVTVELLKESRKAVEKVASECRAVYAGWDVRSAPRHALELVA